MLLIGITLILVLSVAGMLTVASGRGEELTTIAARVALNRHDETIAKAKAGYRDALIKAKELCIREMKTAHSQSVQMGKSEEALVIEQMIGRLETQLAQLHSEREKDQPQDASFDSMHSSFPGQYMWQLPGGAIRPFTFRPDGTYCRTDTLATSLECVWMIKNGKLLIRTQAGVVVVDQIADAQTFRGRAPDGSPIMLRRVGDLKSSA